MKYLYISIALLFVACSNPETNSTSDQEAIGAPARAASVVTDILILNLDATTVTWDRFLDKGPIKREMKIFGSNSTIEIGRLEMNMEGDVEPTGGELVLKNKISASGNLIFNMSTFNLSQEQDDQELFNVTEHPESELIFTSFEVLAGDSINNYTASATLNIEGHGEDYSFPVSITGTPTDMKLTGNFKMTTLDFPLRNEERTKEINVDDITVFLKLIYKK